MQRMVSLLECRRRRTTLYPRVPCCQDNPSSPNTLSPNAPTSGLFKVSDKDDTKLYETRTDGHLTLPNDKRSKIIVEVKPMVHDECQ